MNENADGIYKYGRLSVEGELKYVFVHLKSPIRYDLISHYYNVFQNNNHQPQGRKFNAGVSKAAKRQGPGAGRARQPFFDNEMHAKLQNLLQQLNSYLSGADTIMTRMWSPNRKPVTATPQYSLGPTDQRACVIFELIVDVACKTYATSETPVTHILNAIHSGQIDASALALRVMDPYTILRADIF